MFALFLISTRQTPSPGRWHAGFTLIELITVIMLLSILSIGTVRFLNDSAEGFLTGSQRSELAADVRQSVQVLGHALREALPNSIRVSGGGDCVEFVPVINASDYVSAPIDFSGSTMRVVPFDAPVSGGAWRVALVPGSSLYALASPGPLSPLATAGTVDAANILPLNFSSAHEFTSASGLQRFFVVEQPVSFCLSGGVLYRYRNYGYQAVQPGVATLPTGLPNRDMLAGGISSASPVFAERVCVDSSSSASSGSLTDSGGSGGSYANNETCGFRIQASSGDTITLSFSAFSCEATYDFLRVYDGSWTSGTLLGSFDGNSIPSDLTATSGDMYIVSDTNFIVQDDGFVATWTVTAGGGGTSNICSSSSSTSATGTLTDSGGSSANYGNNETCDFTIQAGAGESITLAFTAFNYESGFDFLRVYDGTSASGVLLESFDGSSLPGDVMATSGNMFVEHDTDFSLTRSGFVADWSISSGTVCAAKTVADNFASIAYSSNAGTQNWVGDWQEIGESDGPSAGISRVNSSNCSSGQCLRIGEPGSASSYSNRGAYREADLDGATTATLTFVYRTGYASGTQRRS